MWMSNGGVRLSDWCKATKEMLWRSQRVNCRNEGRGLVLSLAVSGAHSPLQMDGAPDWLGSWCVNVGAGPFRYAAAVQTLLRHDYVSVDLFSSRRVP
jgi:hypothetical protein